MPSPLLLPRRHGPLRITHSRALRQGVDQTVSEWGTLGCVRPSEPTLAEILGGRGGALDASVPVVVFVVACVVAGALDAAGAVVWAGLAALGAGVLIAAVRLARGSRPRAVLLGLLGVGVAVTVALYTGRAVDFFL